MSQFASQHGPQDQERFREDAAILDQLSSVAQDDRVQTLESEQLEIQVVTARRYPRSIRQFMIDAESMAAISEDMAASCFYSVPRAGKTITGPSVRLAEICMSAWGHLDAGTRVKEIADKYVVVEGFAWDMQKNNKVRQEIRRGIMTSDKGGKPARRYNEDMITTTINAGASIALRNAIFRIIPRAYVDTLMEKARLVAMGDIKTLAARRESAVQYFVKAGVLAERIWAALDVRGIEDVTLEHLLTLQGFRTAIKDSAATLDDCFPGPEKASAALPTKGGSLKPSNGTPKTEAPKQETPPPTKPDGEIIDTPAPKAEPPKPASPVNMDADDPLAGPERASQEQLNQIEDEMSRTGIQGMTVKRMVTPHVKMLEDFAEAQADQVLAELRAKPDKPAGKAGA
jgi:hypothetical protein